MEATVLRAITKPVLHELWKNKYMGKNGISLPVSLYSHLINELTLHISSIKVRLNTVISRADLGKKLMALVRHNDPLLMTSQRQ